MLYRCRPERTVGEIYEFIRKHDTKGRALGKWPKEGVLAQIVKSANSDCILISENDSSEINGICLGRLDSPTKMHVIAIVTSEAKVFSSMLRYWHTMFPGFTLTGRRHSLMHTYQFQNPELERKRALFDICYAKAQEIVATIKQGHPHCEGVMCGGDDPAQGINESTAQMLQAYTQYLPGLVGATSGQILPLEQAKLAASQATAPGQAQLQTDLYKQFGPQLNEIGNQIAQQNQLAQASSDLATMRGPGGELITEAQRAMERVDPEYFATRAAGGKAIQDLLGSINVNGLSGSERAEVERSLARDNSARGTEAPTATSTVSNAMTFGGALNSKRDQLNKAIQTATSFMPSSRSGIDPFQVATGRSSVPNTGESKFAGVQPVGQDALGFGSSVLGNMNQQQMNNANINANRRDSLDRVNSTLDSTLGNICCFNFFEALDGPLPWFVREERNRYCKEEPQVMLGYLWMSRWLVPAMQHCKLVKELVRELMVYPIIQRGGWLKCVDGYRHGWIYEPYKKFWFRVWKFCGKHFTSSSKEVI